MSKLPYTSLFIDGFRGLRNLEMSDLGPINLLVGENNSGKTSVLEALSIMCNPFDPYEWLAMIRRRDFGGLDETIIQSLRWCFTQSGELADPAHTFHAACEMRCDGQFPLRQLRAEYYDLEGFPDESDRKRMSRFRSTRSEEISFDEPWSGADIVHFVKGEEKKTPDSPFELPSASGTGPITAQFWEDDRFLRHSSRRTREVILPNETLTPYSYQLNRLQVSSHSRQLFKGPSAKNDVLDLIRQFDPEVVDIEIASFRGRRPAIYLNHKRIGPAPLSVFGDALRRAVLLSSTLHALKGGLLLIDEVETGIHVGALGRVFNWLVKAAKDFNVQVIATTHSLEAVDNMMQATEANIDDLVTYHLRNEDGETRAKRIAGELLRRLREKRGLDVR